MAASTTIAGRALIFVIDNGRLGPFFESCINRDPPSIFRVERFDAAPLLALDTEGDMGMANKLDKSEESCVFTGVVLW